MPGSSLRLNGANNAKENYENEIQYFLRALSWPLGVMQHLWEGADGDLMETPHEPAHETEASPHHCCLNLSLDGGKCPCHTHVFQIGPRRFLTYGAHGVRPRNFVRALLIEVEQDSDGGLTNGAPSREGEDGEGDSDGEGGGGGGSGGGRNNGDTPGDPPGTDPEDGGAGMIKGGDGEGSGSEGEPPEGLPPEAPPPPKVKLSRTARRNASKKKSRMFKGVKQAARALAAERLVAARETWNDSEDAVISTNDFFIPCAALVKSMWNNQKTIAWGL